MSDNLFFTVITVNNELNAYKVFETLNAGGVQLSSADLLKNYLFCVIDKNGKGTRDIQSRWESLVSRLEAEKFPDYLRAFRISEGHFVRHADLFKKIRTSITEASQAYTLLRGLEENLDTYINLLKPEESQWTKEAKCYVRYLRIFNVKQPIPVLMAAHRVLSDNDFTAFLRIIVVFSFRYHVICSRLPQELESLYSDLCADIMYKGRTTLSAIIEGLEPVYVSDDAFQTAFEEKTFTVSRQGRNANVIHYIFTQLENKRSGIEINAEDNAYTIEHILPQNAEIGWEKFSDEEHQYYVNRLGNMTLLSRAENNRNAALSFSEKRTIFEQSNLCLTSELADYDNWLPADINRRQQQMAKQATAIWRISQFDK